MDIFQKKCHNDTLYCSELHKAFTVFQTKVHLKSSITLSMMKSIKEKDERVCILKLELVETTSLLKKEEMTPKLGGSTENIIEDIHFQD
jgi:hypothetical protein